MGQLAVAAANGSGGSPDQFYWSALYHLQTSYWDSYNYENFVVDQELWGRVNFPILDSRLGKAEVYACAYRIDGKKTQGFFNHTTRDSKGGLGAYGIQVNLFPYRNFPLTLYYDYDSRGLLYAADDEKNSSERAGFDLLLKQKYFQILKFTYNRIKLETVGGSSTNDLFTVNATKTKGQTNLLLNFFWDRARSPGDLGGDSKSMSIGEESHTYLKRGNLYTSAGYNMFESDGLKYGDLNLTTYMDYNFTENSQLVTGGGLRNWESDGNRSNSYGLFTGWRWFRNRDSFNAGIAYTGSSDEAKVRDGLRALGSGMQLYGGWNRSLNHHWHTALDFTYSSGQGSDGNGYGVHAGLLWGRASLPQLMERMAFFVRDISFSRRMYEEFAPGYVPPELEMARAAYKADKRGSVRAGIDFYRFEESGGLHRVLDRLRAEARFTINGHLSLWFQGDALKEKSDLNDTKGYTAQLTADYTLRRNHRFYLTVSGASVDGFFDRLGQKQDRTGMTFGYDYTGARYLTLTLTGEYYKVSGGFDYKRFRAYVPVRFGLLRTSLVYEYTERNNIKSHRISLDLARLFFGGY